MKDPGTDPAADRRRRVLGRILRALLTSAALLIAYYAAPFSGRFPLAQLMVLVLGLACAGVLLSMGVRSVSRSVTPRVRAIEVLVLFLPIFLISFASAYYGMSLDRSGAFSQKINRTDSLYFTVTTFSTVGYGDIVPTSQGARIVVMVQMLGDVALIGVGAHVLLGAVQTGLKRRDEDRDKDEDKDEDKDVPHVRGPRD